MNTTTAGVNGPRRAGTLRRAGAVLAGLLTIIILSVATDVVMHATGIFPPTALPAMSNELFGVATAYRIVYGVLGSYVTARLAPDRPMAHALTLAGIGTLLSTAGGIVMWEYAPAWYTLTVIAISFPCAWAGVRLYERSR